MTTGLPPAQTLMPRYRVVRECFALKIKAIQWIPGAHVHQITPEDGRFAPFDAPPGFMAAFRPESGGYYVVHPEGSVSFQSAAAFEREATLVQGSDYLHAGYSGPDVAPV